MISSPNSLLKPIHHPATEDHFVELLEKLEGHGCQSALSAISNDANLGEFIKNVMNHSRYLRDIMRAHPDFLEQSICDGFDGSLDNILNQLSKIRQTELSTQDAVMRDLRVAKKSAALTIGLADLGGWWPQDKVVRKLSEFADGCLSTALDFLIRSAANQGKLTQPPQGINQNNFGLMVLAMGKYGAFELNYSSDIDLILLYNETAATYIAGGDPSGFFARFARQFVKIMQERTADGYVFRTDLRLRPDPSSTPAIMSLEAALIYYESYGQNWERAAMIKARPAAGDIEAGEQFLKEMRPFIWRKHLDFAAISDVHSIKRQIHAHKGHGQVKVAGHNIKLGRGGIREIEFFAQTQQLIAGGRMPRLRCKNTIEALQKLCEEGWIEASTVEELQTAYWFLRKVEHRLQMVADQQTHTLPDKEGELAQFAAMMDFPTLDGFKVELCKQLRCVEQHYASLFEKEQELTVEGNLVFTGDEVDPGTIETLKNMGFQRPTDMVRLVRGWHYGRYPALRTQQAREILTAITPNLLSALVQAGDGDDAMTSMDEFLSGLPAGVQFFSILKSNPLLLDLFSIVMAAAPNLATIIRRRPGIFDSMMDPALSEAESYNALLAERFKQFLPPELDYELLLDRARMLTAEHKFLIGTRVLNQEYSCEAAEQAFSDLARQAIAAIVPRAIEEFNQLHGNVGGGKIAILAMGKLGSSELTFNSDLDLIFLYDHDPKAEYSDGRKPLPVSQYFVRLVQRIITAMSVPTGQGTMYELDFRLRPSGNAGPLATHINAFYKYQRDSAWIWEHQALCRAQPVWGDEEFCARVSDDIVEILSTNHPEEKLRTEIYAMRNRILEQKKPVSIWDFKTARGGLTDIEFIAQWGCMHLVRNGCGHHKRPAKVLELMRGDLLDSQTCDVLLKAHEHYKHITQYLRICVGDQRNPEHFPKALKEMLCNNLSVPSFSAAQDVVQQLNHDVAEIFERQFSS